MFKKLVIILTACLFAMGVFTLALADDKKAEKAEKKEEKPAHDYIGAKKCSMCHKKDGTAPSWEKTPHANAWENVDTLKLADEKKEACKSCHATGVTAKGDFLPHVQCEACHGPGSDYKGMKIMKNRELAIKNGLIIPDEESCKSCHDKSKAPEKFHADMPEKFDFEKMKAKGIHDLPSQEKKK
jgi:hypothetical protein